MITPELIDYIKNQFKLGRNEEGIKTLLKNVGWQDGDIEEAFKTIISPNQANQHVSFGDAPSQQFSVFSFSQLLKRFSRELNKIPLVVISIIIGVLMIGSGVFTYFYYFQSPEKSVQLMTDKLNKIESAFECKLPHKEGFKIITVKIEFPKGIKNQNDYKAIVSGDKYQILNNRFCAYIADREGISDILAIVDKERISVIEISSENEKDFPLFVFISSVNREDKEIVVNSLSTLIFLISNSNVFLKFNLSGFTAFVPPAAIIQDTFTKIERNPEVTELVNEINKKEILLADDFEKGGILEKNFNKTLNSVMSIIRTDNSPNSLARYVNQKANSQKISNDFNTLRQALLEYFNKNKIFPPSLDQLVHYYLSKIPNNPASGDSYEYSLTEEKQNFLLCFINEINERQCIDKSR